MYDASVQLISPCLSTMVCQHQLRVPGAA